MGPGCNELEALDFEIYLVSYVSLIFYCFSLQLEDKVVKQCDEISGDEVGEINWNASGGIKKPSDYVESWRILL